MSVELNASNSHEFECYYCKRVFYILVGHYEGQFDHEPNLPTCDECQEKIERGEL